MSQPVSQAAFAAAAAAMAGRSVIHSSTIARVAQTGPMQYVAQTAPRNAPIVQPSPVMLTPEQNRKHVLKLYRKVVRSVPRILLAYEITGGPTLERDVVATLRSQFARHAGVTDMGVTAVLRHKAEMEVTESLLMWKTKSHVCNMVLNEQGYDLSKLMQKQQQEAQLPEQAKESPFLTSFYQG